MRFERRDAACKPRCPDCRSTRLKLLKKSPRARCETCGGNYLIADVPGLAERADAKTSDAPTVSS